AAESDKDGGSSNGGSGKRRRTRANFNGWQLEASHYPDVFMRMALAMRLDLILSRVRHSDVILSLAPPRSWARFFSSLADDQHLTIF
ncbi:hypothetical protein MTO96_039319, partial [Rhipicephalus appendiculatus]